MHSTSKLTCSDRTSATVRGSVMTGSGRTGRKATYRQQAAQTGAQRATAPIRPEPHHPTSAIRHGSPGWGETPLARAVTVTGSPSLPAGGAVLAQRGQRGPETG